MFPSWRLGKQCIDGVEEVKRKTWSIFNNELQNPKDKLLALKLIKKVMKPSLHYLRMVHPL
jgi:hypothetical protein